MKSAWIGLAATAGLLVAACGGEAADGVAAPGVRPDGDVRPTLSVATGATTDAPAASPVESPAATTVVPVATAASTTTTGVTTETDTETDTDTDNDTATATTAPATTVPATTAAPTTQPETTTTAAPTTTELVYVPEPAEGALRVGMEGPRSLKVQQDLIALGILPATAADSKYGPGTASGVRRFQASQGLVVDGVTGPNTQAALAAALAALAPPTTG